MMNERELKIASEKLIKDFDIYQQMAQCPECKRAFNLDNYELPIEVLKEVTEYLNLKQNQYQFSFEQVFQGNGMNLWVMDLQKKMQYDKIPKTRRLEDAFQDVGDFKVTHVSLAEGANMDDKMTEGEYKKFREEVKGLIDLANSIKD